jgi:hypothetical protein
MSGRSLKSSRQAQSQSGEPIGRSRREAASNLDLSTDDWRLETEWPEQRALNQGDLSGAGRREATSDRSQSVRSSDEASNDRGAKGHRKEEMQ